MISAEVHVAVEPVSTDGWDLLSPLERDRAAGIGASMARARFVTGRATLRRLLGAGLACAPAEVPLGTDRDGRPTLLVPTDLHCSLSHTRDLVVVAVARGHLVGVDVERLDRRPLPPLDAWLSLAERHRLDEAVGPERDEGLVRRWTAKEAVVKALAHGLAIPLATVEVDGDRARITATSSTYRLTRLPAGPAHVATMASAPLVQGTRSPAHGPMDPVPTSRQDG